EHSHPRLRGHHHWRYRFDPRRVRGCDHRRADRYDRAFLSARCTAPGAEHQRRPDLGAVVVVDVDLHADGSDPGVPPRRSVSGGESMTVSLEPSLNAARPGLPTARTIFTAGLVAILALVPVYALVTGETFGVALFTRTIILAIGAISLNLIMGYGGMVSFGQAAFLGIG